MFLDNNLQFVIEKRIGRTIENLKKNKMDAYYAKTSSDAVKIALEIMNDGDVVTCGGSMTIAECGLLDEVKNSGKYTFLDRNREGITPDEVKKIYREAFSCNTYLTSSNAITENGELFNADGNSNRVSAMLFGPDSVIVIAGYNKIVPDIEHAVERLKKIAAPANAKRLNCKTPCTVSGTCMDCHGDSRICCNYVVMGQQRIQSRVKVIIVGEELGY